MKKPLILLIDDHAMFRSGLRLLLNEAMPSAEVLEAGSLNEATKVRPVIPDVALLDIKLPGLNGMEGIALLKKKWPALPVIMLSSEDEVETVNQAMARGADGFVSKAETADNIVRSIQLAASGELSELASLAKGNSASTISAEHLTPRQCQVLDLLNRGLSNKLIARELFLSENTVRGHVQAILEFFQVASRSEAVFEARQRGLVS